MQSIEDTKQTRRIQISGGSTYTISLPKKWIDEIGIKNGDNMTIVKNANHSMTLFPGLDTEKPRRRAVITISQKDAGESIQRKIIAVYLNGYKTIQIISKGVKILPEHSRLIKDLVRRSMIGTEIVESDSESITIQILTRLPELTFDVALKRMHLMTSNMHREAIEALSKNDIAYGEEVARMDDEVDRFSLYMMRTLIMAIQNASMLYDMELEQPSDCLNYRTVISRIERIADHAALIAKRIKFLKDPLEPKTIKEIQGLSEDAINCFDNSILALTKKDPILAEKIASGVEEIVKKEEALMYGIKESKNSTIIKFVLEDIRRTAEYSSDIIEVVINKTISSIISEK
ncbi:phosphate signaling complex PhoU family protein [Candidatus Nitrosotenuis uzonensis]|uniref:Putative Phosphate uptake regulator, PhoU n=1 Tax=Candidatus Nitrosotenuis uzonensis TaxID=1407055 RepID=A0A812F5S8_9ARCH|nr:phosphate uptake regulator PhoU [Candidatus Nitrosotenuis uzonensis]CAE6492456.1 putative Phosphate uptake regulator, PhoU [Candidatus Nitrosotenuis uzonensis]